MAYGWVAMYQAVWVFYYILHLTEQIKKDQMGGAYSVGRGEDKLIQNLDWKA